MTQTPTDALRLVPVEPTEAMVADGVKAAQRAEQTCVSWPEMALFTYRAMLAAAPASPLPGVGDWIDGTPEVPVGSPTWCGWASYEIRRLRSELPAAPTGDA